jgi:DNA processing protein
VKIRKITPKDSEFPDSLRQIPSPPKELYVLGNLAAILGKPSLSVVGSRKVTPYGKTAVSELVRPAAASGVVIVSGMAIGMDALAHKAALEVGGQTIAVLACGLDKPYPLIHHQLARDILQNGGVLISEYPPGTPPMQFRFIERNRLVSGLGGGVLIIEAAQRSGTLHTANFALEQGKSVMAVPGNITSAYSMGTNLLIKTGATPVTTPDDIFEALGLTKILTDKEIIAANADEAVILKLIKKGTTDGSELQQASKLDTALFNQTLTMLEISGKIKPLGAGHWALC